MFERGDALSAFRAMSPTPIESLSIGRSFGLLIDFFERQRASGAAPLAEDGDMLLLQWRPNKRADGAPFEVNLTRQLIYPDGEDAEMFQLSLTYSYAASTDLEALGKNAAWFHSPEDAAQIRRQVLDSPALVLCSTLAPSLVSLDWDQV